MTLKDDLGRTVTLPGGPARRIVSLSPAATENLFAIGAGSLIVGVSAADDYPPDVRRLPRVGDYGKPAYERILALRPDGRAVHSPFMSVHLEKRLRPFDGDIDDED